MATSFFNRVSTEPYALLLTGQSSPWQELISEQTSELQLETSCASLPPLPTPC